MTFKKKIWYHIYYLMGKSRLWIPSSSRCPGQLLTSVERKGKKYIIWARTDYVGTAIMATLRQALSFCAWAEREGFTILVEHEWTKKKFIDEQCLGENNILDSVIVQKEKIENILKVPNVYLIKWNAFRLFTIPYTIKYNKTFYAYSENVRYDGSPEYYSDLHDLFFRNFDFNSNIWDAAVLLHDEAKKERRILGVMLREEFASDKKKQVHSKDWEEVLSYHPENISINDQLSEIKKLMSEWECDSLIVSCERQSTIDRVIGEFGDMVIHSNRQYVTYEEEQMLYEDPLYFEKIQNDSSYMKKTREEIIEKCCYYATDVVALSLCDCFIGATCSGTQMTLVTNGGKFEKYKVFEDCNNASVYQR